MITKNMIILVATVFVSMACMEEFDDPTQSIVKKTEIVAITLDPPEVAPGDTVTARVVVADRHGQIETLPTLWMLETPTAQDALLGGHITFEVPDLPDDAFDIDGKAALPISVAVAKRASVLSELATIDADSILDNEDVLFGMRTLTVSKSAVQNHSPQIGRLILKTPQGGPEEITAAVSTDADVGIAIQQAKIHAVGVRAEEEVEFRISAQPTFAQNDLLFQWISTGGDFKARREAIEPWIAPAYVEPKPGAVVDPANPHVREDPNLYPVWVIVRDDGEPYHLGQTVVTFYVRVLPNP